MNKIIFIIKDFLPILIFYIINHFFNLKLALISSIICTIVEITFLYLKKLKISNFFKFSALLTIIFGFIDLYLQKITLFKYESSLTNIFIGTYFALSVINGKPLIRHFAESWKMIPQKIDRDLEFYFKFITIIWTLYFFVKAIIYGYISYYYNLEKALLIRIIFGKITFFVLLFISIFGSSFIIKILNKLCKK